MSNTSKRNQLPNSRDPGGATLAQFDPKIPHSCDVLVRSMFRKTADPALVDVAGNGHFLMQVAPKELNNTLIETITILENGITPPTSG